MRARSVAAYSLLGLVVAACAAGRATPSAAEALVDASVAPDAIPPRDDSSDDDAAEPPLPLDSGSEASACASPCGIAPQCGCAAFESCDIAADAARGCTSSGSNVVGRACLGTFECARGLLCLSGVCRAPCEPALAPCAAGSCSDYAKAPSDGGVSASLAACSVACDYADEGSCGFRPGDLAGAACVFRAALGRAECMSVRNVQLQSGVCAEDAECGAGRVCVATSMGFSSCRRLCKLGAADACGGCGAFPVSRVVGGVTFGYCP